MITIGRSRFIGSLDQIGAGPEGGGVTPGGLVVVTVVISVVTSVTGTSVGIVVTVPTVPF